MLVNLGKMRPRFFYSIFVSDRAIFSTKNVGQTIQRTDSDFQTLEPKELFTEKSKVEQNSAPMEKDTWIYQRRMVFLVREMVVFRKLG